MQSGQKQAVLEKGEKERKKKGGSNKTKNKGEYPLILYTGNPSTSPGTFQCCLVNNLLFPCPSRWFSGGGACCADFQVLAVEGAALPLPGAGLSGGCLPREAAGGTAPVAAAALEPWSQPPQ